MSERVDGLLAQLSLDEKVGLVSGRDMWRNHGVERLGIPPMKVSDGPNGARGQHFEGFHTSACFPCGSALAATWNPELVEQVGAALGQETRSKGAQLLLAPTINIHRSPLAGRNFECYSEDPHLSARMAVAFVRGVQSQGVGATPKHYVCNDSEFERHTISSEVGERALREIYLPPFEAVVKEARPWSLMTGYNRVHGTYCAEHERLLQEVLRDEWGFDGFVISDWFGAQSTVASANHGLDLEMPGAVRHFGDKLKEAVESGAVPAEQVDTMAGRILVALERMGVLDEPVPDVEVSDDRPEHRALARRAAAESLVLLRNEGGLLPLDAGSLKSLALIGPNVDAAMLQGGGSARVAPHRTVSPLEGIRAELGDGVALRFERGCSRRRGVHILDTSLLEPLPDYRTPELGTDLFAGPDLAGEPVAHEARRKAECAWIGPAAPSIDPSAFSARMHGRFAAPESGTYRFTLRSEGKTRLLLDGELVLDNWDAQVPGDGFFGKGSSEVEAQVELEAGSVCDLSLEFSYEGGESFVGFLLGCEVPEPEDSMERAVAAAADSDAAVVVVGLDAEWESEGHDRADMSLPGRQAELIEKVLAANPRTVVIVNAGSPVLMEWAERTPAIVQAWCPGQECGHALADVLFGSVSPSGRLPTSFPRRYEDNPASINYPGENGEVVYGEGIFVGYRYYDTKHIEPLFPFGHGLSYTAFEYGDIELERVVVGSGEPVRFRVRVRNSGSRAGSEVVQVYVHDRESRLSRPEQELRAFEKVILEPGEEREVEITLDARALAFYDPAAPAWVAEPGTFELRVGRSSRDIVARADLELKG